MRALPLLLPLGLSLGCSGSVETIPHESSASGTSSGGAGGIGGNTSSSASSVATTGMGGAGGNPSSSTSSATTTGMGGAGVCAAGSILACYDGPAGTENIGVCKGGTQTCNALGTAYGDCVGEIVPSSDYCETPVDEDCNGSVMPCVSNGTWSKSYVVEYQSHLRQVAVDPQQNIIAVGAFEGTADFGAGQVSGGASGAIWVVKLTPTGDYLWSKTFGTGGGNQDGTGADTYGMTVDYQGNILITGLFAGALDFGAGPFKSQGAYDTFVVKLDPMGNYLWSQDYGNAQAMSAGFGVASDSMGNVALIGTFNGSVDFGGGPLGGGGIFVAKLDSNGNHIWSKGVGGDPQSMAIATDPNDGIVVGGGSQQAVDFGSGPLMGSGIFVARLDGSGNQMWGKRFGSSYANLRSIAVDSANAIALSGDFSPPLDFGGGDLASSGPNPSYVAKLDKDGNHVFSLGFGTDVALGWGVTTDASNNVIIDGSFQGAADFGAGPLMSSPGSPNLYVAKFGPAGNLLWGKSFGGTSQNGEAVAVDAAGAPIVGGQYSMVLDLGDGPLPNPGQIYDAIFIAKLAP